MTSGDSVSASRDAPASWASLEGLPFPLGATWVAADEAWNFAVYSEHAYARALHFPPG